MGVRLITLALAGILAATTNGIGAQNEPEPASSTKISRKETVKKPEQRSPNGTTQAQLSTRKTSKSAGKSAVTESKAKAGERLPRGYGKLKLTQDQRAAVLTIQREYRARIEKMLADLDDLKISRDVEFQKVLDQSQRDLLQVKSAKVATSGTK
jgi:hypothetical protein